MVRDWIEVSVVSFVTHEYGRCNEAFLLDSRILLCIKRACGERFQSRYMQDMNS